MVLQECESSFPMETAIAVLKSTAIVALRLLTKNEVVGKYKIIK